MKLVQLYEAEIHPDLIPAMDRITEQCIEKIRAAGVEIMPAREHLNTPHSTKDPKGEWQYNPGHRWIYSGYSTKRWLVGYIKMGSIYLGVYMGLDGSLMTQAQYKSGWSDREEVNQSYYRAYKDVDHFIKYLHEKFKPFVSTEPLKRFADFLAADTPKIHYPFIASKKASDALGDEDEFGTRGMIDVKSGVVEAAYALAKLIRGGNKIDPNNITTLINGYAVKDWITHSGLEIEVPKYDQWIAANPNEVYLADESGGFYGELNWPKEIVDMLIARAKKVSKTVMSRAQKIAAKPEKPKIDPAQHLLNQIFNQPPQQPLQ